MKSKISPRLRLLLLSGIYALGIFGILASDSSSDGNGVLLCTLEIRGIAPVIGPAGEVWVGLLAETEDGTVDRVSRLGGNGLEQVAVDIATGNSENAIRTIAIAVDGANTGDIYVGGDFSEGILRLNPDGTLDAGFAVGTGFNGRVNSIVPAADGSGDIYVGGNFSAYQGVLAGGLVRLKDVGTRDDGFVAIVSNIEAVAMEGSGSSDVYGGGSGFPPLERYNSFGTPDTTPEFNPSLGIFPVYTIAPALDGTDDVYVGGGFSDPNRIIRLSQDGTPDNLFVVGTGFDDDVTRIVRANDGSNEIYAGGEFTAYQGSPAGGIVRLGITGSNVNSFVTGAGFSDPTDLSSQSQVISLARAADGSTDLYVGGGFTRYDGRIVNGLVRLNANGSLDTGFDVRIIVNGRTCDNSTVRR
ncbi:MAG: delta-60 repeat domain-containing protein [Gammaproteobacteria bacterium]|nr:MAG: delta-60 repeat domain-containing protein [Gammaproteobacteria bacterium]